MEEAKSDKKHEGKSRMIFDCWVTVSELSIKMTPTASSTMSGRSDRLGDARPSGYKAFPFWA